MFFNYFCTSVRTKALKNHYICMYQLIRDIIRIIQSPDIHESDSGHEMDYRIRSSPSIPTTRGDHELQGWSRLRDFLEPICPSREGEGFPLYRIRARFRDTGGYICICWEILSRCIYVFIFCPSSPLYPPLDYGRVRASINKKRTQFWLSFY